MGFGQALGQGVQAYQAERQRNIKNDVVDREMVDREAATAQNIKASEQNISSSKTNQKISQAEFADWNSPTSTKLRAEKKKLDLQVLQIQSSAANRLNGQDKQKINELENKVVETNKAVNDQKQVAQSKTVVNNTMTDYAETGSVTNHKEISDWVKGEPILASIVKGPITRVNLKDPVQSQLIDKMAIGIAKAQGIEDPSEVEGIKVAVRDLSDSGIIAYDPAGEQMVDIQGLFELTGLTKSIPNSTVQKYTEVTHKQNVASGEKYMKQQQDVKDKSSGPDGIATIPSWNKATTGEDALWQGMDPIQAYQDYQTLGMSVPLDLKELAETQIAAKGNSEKKGYWGNAGPEEAQEGFNNLLLSVANGNTDPRHVARAQSYVSNIKGEKAKGKAAKQLKTAVDASKSRRIFESDESVNAERVSGENKIWRENTEIGNSDDFTTMERDAKIDIQNTVGSVNRIDGIIGNLKTFADSGDLVTGLFADSAKDILTRDSGAFEKAADLIKTADTEEGKNKARAKLDRMLRNTIKIDTPLGLELAKFIKEMSGAAVSDQERAFLVDIVTGIQRGNPAYVGQALESFRDARIQMMQPQLNDRTLQTKMPDTVFGGTTTTMDRLGHHTTLPAVNTVIETVTNSTGDQSYYNKAKSVISEWWKKDTVDDEDAQVQKFIGGE